MNTPKTMNRISVIAGLGLALGLGGALLLTLVGGVDVELASDLRGGLLYVAFLSLLLAAGVMVRRVVKR